MRTAVWLWDPHLQTFLSTKRLLLLLVFSTKSQKMQIESNNLQMIVPFFIQLIFLIPSSIVITCSTNKQPGKDDKAGKWKKMDNTQRSPEVRPMVKRLSAEPVSPVVTDGKSPIESGPSTVPEQSANVVPDDKKVSLENTQPSDQNPTSKEPTENCVNSPSVRPNVSKKGRTKDASAEKANCPAQRKLPLQLQSQRHNNKKTSKSHESHKNRTTATQGSPTTKRTECDGQQVSGNQASEEDSDTFKHVISIRQVKKPAQ